MTDVPTLRAMVKLDDDWAVCRFEFDSDGRGVRWRMGRSSGGDPVGRMVEIFKQKGYTIVDWDDKVLKEKS